MRYRYIKQQQSSGLDMTPLMDIIFLVLIFFMVGATFEMNRALKLELPETFTSEGTISENRILIEIDQNNNTAVNGVICEYSALSDTLQQYHPTNLTELYIMGDERASYKKIIEVMDLVKMLGIEKISLVTNPKKDL